MNPEKHKISIAWKLSAYVLLITGVLSALQLAAAYPIYLRGEMNRLDLDKMEIEKSHVPALTSSLWDFHFSQVKIILKGMLSIPHVSYVALKDNDHSLFFGQIGKGRAIEQRYNLVHGRHGKIGELIVRFSEKSIRSAVWNQVWTIAVPVLVQMLMVSILIILVFRVKVARHLMELAFYAKKLSLKNLDTRFRFRRRKSNHTMDELDMLLNAMDHMRANMIFWLGQQKQMEAQLQQANKMEALGTLAGGVAHDFNNLLMGIQGRASLMLLKNDLSEYHKKNLDEIQSYVQKSAQLTRQLLGFAKGGKYEEKITDLNILIRKTLEMFHRTRKGIQLEMNFEKNLWPVKVDRSQIEQVFLNLFVNASHAMPSGGRLTVTSENIRPHGRKRPISIVAPGKYVKIEVADTGVGMDESVRLRVFEPFFTTKERGRGTGLGLASAFGIITNHGGTIEVESEPGKGARFYIQLPAVDAECLPDEMQPSKIMPGCGTILVVDDEELILDVISPMLNNLGYEVITASSGREAVAEFKAGPEKIDMVILDMIMPDQSGEKIFHQLKKIDSNVKVILSSGYSIDGTAGQLLQNGCMGFLQKPFTMEKLSEKIQLVIPNRPRGKLTYSP